MKQFAGTIALIFSIVFSMGSTASAQSSMQSSMAAEPVSWDYSVRPLSAGSYELVFKLKLQEGWHIWSLQPGGDGFQIVPSFTFNSDEAFKLQGTVTEAGTVVSKEMEGIEGKVNYFSHTVTYTQKVKAKPGTVITGTHEYQVCTDAMCLPPTDKEFSFTIK